ncbi:MAG: hypothetical protein V1899_12815 [Planctomycetota bacterium]
MAGGVGIPDKQAGQLCVTELLVNGKPRCNSITEPCESIKNLFNAASVILPKVLPCRGIRVATRKKLSKHR